MMASPMIGYHEQLLARPGWLRRCHRLGFTGVCCELRWRALPGTTRHRARRVEFVGTPSTGRRVNGGHDGLASDWLPRATAAAACWPGWGCLRRRGGPENHLPRRAATPPPGHPCVWSELFVARLKARPGGSRNGATAPKTPPSATRWWSWTEHRTHRRAAWKRAARARLVDRRAIQSSAARRVHEGIN